MGRADGAVLTQDSTHTGEAESRATEVVVEEQPLVEEVSIDGMCGVY